MNKILLVLILVLSGLLMSSLDYARAAVLYTGSANQVVYVDEPFLVEWYLDTQGMPINTMALTLKYSPSNLEVVDINVGGSVVDFWVKAPAFNNQTGQINLTGGMAGVSNSKLGIIKATFKPLKPGAAKISLDPKSELLISDGQGTLAPLTFKEVNFVVNPASAKFGRVKSSTHTEQGQWYKNRDVEFLVDTKPNEEYSYTFSSNLEIFPDQNPNDVSQIIKFNDVPDGIYYFKLNSRLRDTANNWQEATVYRVMIDGTPPDEFNPAVAKDQAVFEGQPFVSFVATDNVSGVAYYEVRSNYVKGWERTDNNYFKLSGLVLGDTIEIKVVDVAGNARITKVEIDRSIIKPYFYKPIFWGIILVLIGLVALLIRYYFQLLKKYKLNDQ